MPIKSITVEGFGKHNKTIENLLVNSIATTPTALNKRINAYQKLLTDEKQKLDNALSCMFEEQSPNVKFAILINVKNIVRRIGNYATEMQTLINQGEKEKSHDQKTKEKK